MLQIWGKKASCLGTFLALKFKYSNVFFCDHNSRASSRHKQNRVIFHSHNNKNIVILFRNFMPSSGDKRNLQEMSAIHHVLILFAMDQGEFWLSWNLFVENLRPYYTILTNTEAAPLIEKLQLVSIASPHPKAPMELFQGSVNGLKVTLAVNGKCKKFGVPNVGIKNQYQVFVFYYLHG